MERSGLEPDPSRFFSRSNPPSTDERFRELVLVDDSFKIVCVSLRVVILSFERLTALTLSARVITNLIERGIDDC